MIASNRTEMPKIGEIRFDHKTGRRKRYNGVQWHVLCRVDNCPLASTFNDLCARHRCDVFHPISKQNEIESKNIIDRSSPVQSRRSRGLKTIIDAQNFLCDQRREKRNSTRKRRRNSNQIEDIIQRINRQMKTLNERVDQISQIRNLFLSV